MKKALKIVGIILGVVLLFFIGMSIYFKIKLDRGDLIIWDGKLYTKEELKKAFPPQEYNVASKNTPEEVYTTFRQALLNNDIEGALGQMTFQSREEYRKAFSDKAKFNKWVKSLPEKITKEREYGNYSYYDVDYGTSNKNTATFIKNSDGYWRIDSI